MLILEDISLRDFEFWCGARAIADKLTDDELMLIEVYLDEISDHIHYMTATDVNDLFWFEDELIAEILGYDDSDALWDELLTR